MLAHERKLKRFLYLCTQNPNTNIGMFSTTIDNLWHTFIIYTKDYNDYCQNTADTFLHHIPAVEKIP